MKAAVAALSLVLIVPGLAQSQAPAPPYLLDPGESPPSVPPPTSPPGTYPSATTPLGIDHPECLAIYGKTRAQIEATPCTSKYPTLITNSGNDWAANNTYTACSHNNIIDFQGDNVTLDCVKWSTGAATFGTRCEGASPCDNIVFRRVTATGSNGQANQNMIQLSSRGGQPLRSILIEDSDISRADVPLWCGSAANGDVAPLPGQGNKAFVVRHSRIHGITQAPSSHTDLMFLAESCRGVLVENNLFDGSDAIGGVNVGSAIQVQGQSATFGNMVFRNNHIIHDGSGSLMNLDRDDSTTSDACADPVIFDSNKFTWSSDGNDTLFIYGSAPRDCTRIESRPGSSCTNNTFANGSPAKCSSDGL